MPHLEGGQVVSSPRVPQTPLVEVVAAYVLAGEEEACSAEEEAAAYDPAGVEEA